MSLSKLQCARSSCALGGSLSALSTGQGGAPDLLGRMANATVVSSLMRACIGAFPFRSRCFVAFNGPDYQQTSTATRACLRCHCSSANVAGSSGRPAT
jgi:hypothetical protein